jgi:hypothetical protein
VVGGGGPDRLDGIGLCLLDQKICMEDYKSINFLTQTSLKTELQPGTNAFELKSTF